MTVSEREGAGCECGDAGINGDTGTKIGDGVRKMVLIMVVSVVMLAQKW